MVDYNEKDDNIQHGIDDNPHGDAKKGATLGGVGGVVTGAIAGAAAGPAGAVAGAIIGGVAGALGSGAAVAAVDAVDNDNKVSGLGDGADFKDGDRYDSNTSTTNREGTYANDPAYRSADRLREDDTYRSTGDSMSGSGYQQNTPTSTGSTQASGMSGAAGTASPLLNDSPSYQAGSSYSSQNDLNRSPGANYDLSDNPGGTPTGVGGNYSSQGGSFGTPNSQPGIQTGGQASDGSNDTRGITEKVSDFLTGNNVDDKTGKSVEGPDFGRVDGYNTQSHSGVGSAAYTGGQTPTGVPNNQPGIQTGGTNADGSADTRGITEKVADALTGDKTDDKTGRRV